MGKGAWACVSVDPILHYDSPAGVVWLERKSTVTDSVVRGWRGVRGLCMARARIQAVSIPCRRAIIVLMHSHVTLADAVAAVDAREGIVGVVACPCCSWADAQASFAGRAPDAEFADPALLSVKNLMRVWVQRDGERAPIRAEDALAIYAEEAARAAAASGGAAAVPEAEAEAAASKDAERDTEQQRFRRLPRKEYKQLLRQRQEREREQGRAQTQGAGPAEAQTPDAHRTATMCQRARALGRERCHGPHGAMSAILRTGVDGFAAGSAGTGDAPAAAAAAGPALDISRLAAADFAASRPDEAVRGLCEALLSLLRRHPMLPSVAAKLLRWLRAEVGKAFLLACMRFGLPDVEVCVLGAVAKRRRCATVTFFDLFDVPAFRAHRDAAIKAYHETGPDASKSSEVFDTVCPFELTLLPVALQQMAAAAPASHTAVTSERAACGTVGPAEDAALSRVLDRHSHIHAVTGRLTSAHLDRSRILVLGDDGAACMAVGRAEGMKQKKEPVADAAGAETAADDATDSKETSKASDTPTQSVSLGAELLAEDPVRRFQLSLVCQDAENAAQFPLVADQDAYTWLGDVRTGDVVLARVRFPTPVLGLSSPVVEVTDSTPVPSSDGRVFATEGDAAGDWKYPRRPREFGLKGQCIATAYLTDALLVFDSHVHTAPLEEGRNRGAADERRVIDPVKLCPT
jgi:hypothetical protein